MRYFELSLDMDDAHRKGTWSISGYLRDVNGAEVPPWLLYAGERWSGDEPLTVPVLKQGRPLACDLIKLTVPLVSVDLYEAIHDLLPSSTQCLEARVVNRRETLRYSLLNVLEMPDCLDLGQSCLGTRALGALPGRRAATCRDPLAAGQLGRWPISKCCVLQI